MKDHVADIIHGGGSRGGALLLTGRLVVTANHCLRHLNGAHRAEILLADGSQVGATVIERRPDIDLALLRLDTRINAGPPTVGRPAVGEKWATSYRPGQ